MKIIYSLFAIILMLILQSCPKGNEPDMYFYVKNESNINISFYANTVDTIANVKDFGKSNLISIEKDKIFHTNFWTTLFNDNRKFNILIFKESTLDAYSWEEIQEKDLVDKRYVLSLEELKAMNYTVVYDGK